MLPEKQPKNITRNFGIMIILSLKMI